MFLLPTFPENKGRNHSNCNSQQYYVCRTSYASEASSQSAKAGLDHNPWKGT